jgi:transcriptional regulator with XRE-family HTH domain
MTPQVIGAGRALRYRGRMSTTTLPAPPRPAPLPVGTLLREWRQRRRLSQLDLAGEADISTRHLSFVETGRALPSREMVLRLAERLEVPLRERNRLLTAAGYAPMFGERGLDDPALAAAREAVELVLRGHEPYPALAVDRHWTLVSYNRSVRHLLAGLPADLLQPPVNVLRLSLHPQGLAPRIVNLGSWRAHLLTRLRQQVEASGDTTLAALAEELRGYPAPADGPPARHAAEAAVVVPLQLATPGGLLSFISTTTVFGTPVDITLSELALETFFPADAATASALRQLAESDYVGVGVGAAAR